jgi:hypothetical protein
MGASPPHPHSPDAALQPATEGSGHPGWRLGRPGNLSGGTAARTPREQAEVLAKPAWEDRMISCKCILDLKRVKGLGTECRSVLPVP